MAALPSQTKVGEMLPHAILLLVLTPVISYFVLISAWVAEAGIPRIIRQILSKMPGIFCKAT